MILLLVNGIVLYSALVWKLYQLGRAPREVPLRIVVLCLTFGGLAYPLEALLGPAVVSQTQAGPMLLMWAHRLVLMPLIYSLICFFLFTTLNPARARRRALREAVPLAATLATLTVLALLVPTGVDPADYPLTLVATFFLVGDAYTVYGFTMTWRWTRRYAHGARPRLRTGLAITGVGLAAMIVATVLLMVIVTFRWAGTTPPSAVVVAQKLLLVPGIIVFIIGVSYPGAMMRAAAVRLWWRHLRTYHRLRPLWTLLHEAFPDDALTRARVPRTRLRDVVSLSEVNFRWYRRVIECRDGLVRISPHVTALRPAGDLERPPRPAEQAALLHAALRARRDGHPASPTPAPIALPERDDLEADVRALLALSHAVRTSKGTS
ncbi:hypothetical protein GCM10012275_60440 [Longimycelium tulufanense]|uniref:DUF6545 domain-containing protein n=1 Tax=Longimycelium tulufanense TaxID=907463 RepID=A0A8J3FWZ1_9PSEU|nr:MAB_1171c family putative transporter [Longimycelium tulufanense]GGM81739.1 hypothetical protein GCM10012275_60440 [Longimycelium tulufanense]